MRHSAAIRLRALLPNILQPTEDLAMLSAPGVQLEALNSQKRLEATIVRLDKLLKCSNWVYPQISEVASAAGAAGIDDHPGWSKLASTYGLPVDAVQGPSSLLGMALHALLQRCVQGEVQESAVAQRDENDQENVVNRAIQYMLSVEPLEVTKAVRATLEGATGSLQHLRAVVATSMLSYAAKCHTHVCIDYQTVDLTVRFLPAKTLIEYTRCSQSVDETIVR